jgi:hypothetical protein
MAHQLSALAAKTESLNQSVCLVVRDPSQVPEPLLLTHRLGLIDADGAHMQGQRSQGERSHPSELAVSSHASVVRRE